MRYVRVWRAALVWSSEPGSYEREGVRTELLGRDDLKCCRGRPQPDRYPRVGLHIATECITSPPPIRK